MSYNGDAPYNKRMKTDGDTIGSKNGPYGYSDFDNQPRRRKGEPETPNHIILLTIINPAYPITVDVIHTISQTYGNVLRIVIFKKNGVQAMVEYDNVDSATRAREGLQGADIYSGCCTIRVEYAKPSKLNVFKNDMESWDFTNANLNYPERPAGAPARPPLLQEPRFGGMDSPPFRGGGGGGGGGSGGGMNGMGGGPRGLFGGPMGDRHSGMGGGSNGRGGGLAGPAPPFMGGNGGPGSMPMGGGPGPMGMPHQGSVLMVYGLNKDVMNAEKLFNLLCLYGNIVRVKFLKSKEGCAMVQMGDGSAVERCVENLTNVTYFGSKMQLAFSKQAFLADVLQPFTLPDGSPSFIDYMGNKNNRFMNPSMAAKNRIQPPTKILHFFNTPPDMSDDVMEQVFNELEITPPKQVKVFPSKSDRSSSGLLEFNTISEAMEALCVANHSEIPNPSGKFPYIMKLCFSSSRHIRDE